MNEQVNCSVFINGVLFRNQKDRTTDSIKNSDESYYIEQKSPDTRVPTTVLFTF